MQVLCTIFTIWSTLKVISASENDPIDYNRLFGYSPRRDLAFPDLVKYDGYTSETHSVTTDDGYILGLFRIPPSKYCKKVKRFPIIFMHALFLSGDDCVMPGPGKAHCYVYSDNCYDVWVPNVRGNRYSRKHKTLDPDKDPEFWNFTFDDMAEMDVPAIIDYVLQTTGKKQVYYVGHSQGATILLLLCAKKPEYNNKIKMGFGLSVTAWLDHSRYKFLPSNVINAYFLNGARDQNNSGMACRGQLTQKTGSFLCGLKTVEYPVCTIPLFTLLSINNYLIKPDVLRVLPGHVPAETSLKNFRRWNQVRQNGFVQQDYGVANNMKVYGQNTPREYDFSNVTMRWFFIAATNDYVADPRDVQKLTSKLPNAVMSTLADKYFGHLEFVYADVLPDRVLNKILFNMEIGNYAKT